jgi:hypothetical protein
VAISKDDLILLGREVRTAFSMAGVRPGDTVSTKEALGHMAETGSEVLTEDDKARYGALRALAEYGYPGAKRGAPQETRMYGKMVAVRPWLWHLADEGEISAWAEKAGSETRASVKLADRVTALEARVAELEGGK